MQSRRGWEIVLYLLAVCMAVITIACMDTRPAAIVLHSTLLACVFWILANIRAAKNDILDRLNSLERSIREPSSTPDDR